MKVLLRQSGATLYYEVQIPPERMETFLLPAPESCFHRIGHTSSRRRSRSGREQNEGLFWDGYWRALTGLSSLVTFWRDYSIFRHGLLLNRLDFLGSWINDPFRPDGRAWATIQGGACQFAKISRQTPLLLNKRPKPLSQEKVHLAIHRLGGSGCCCGRCVIGGRDSRGGRRLLATATQTQQDRGSEEADASHVASGTELASSEGTSDL